MNLGSLRRLVQETISETKRRNREVFGNPNSTRKQRESFINETIEKTVQLLIEADDDQADGDDVDPGSLSAEERASQSTDEVPAQNLDYSGDAQVAQNQGPKKPYSKLLEDLFGSEGPYNTKGEAGGMGLDQAKSKIRKAVKAIIQNAPQGVEYLQNKALMGAGSEDIIDFVSASPKGADLKPSQLEVFVDQSVDGYLTRPNDFCKSIIAGNLSAESVFISADNYIIDGHHRTSSVNALNPNCTMRVTKMDANIEWCLKILNLLLEINADGEDKVASGKPEKSIWNAPGHPTATKVLAVWQAATGRTGKKGSGSDQFAPPTQWRTSEAIEKNASYGYTDKDGNPKKFDSSKGNATPSDAVERWFLDCFGGDQITQGAEPVPMEEVPSPGAKSWMKWEEAKAKYGNNPEAAAYMCAHNIRAWPGPEDQFGKRSEMPQLDSAQGRNPGGDATIDKVKTQLTGGTGALDWNNPVQESVDLNRWAKLAGILKG